MNLKSESKRARWQTGRLIDTRPRPPLPRWTVMLPSSFFHHFLSFSFLSSFYQFELMQLMVVVMGQKLCEYFLSCELQMGGGRWE